MTWKAEASRRDLNGWAGCSTSPRWSSSLAALWTREEAWRQRNRQWPSGMWIQHTRTTKIATRRTCRPSKEPRPHPTNRPCCKSMATTQNPPNPTQIPLDIHKSPPKSPSISQQMRQTSDQGRKSTNAHTSRALAMIEDTKQANQRGGDDAQGWGAAER